VGVPVSACEGELRRLYARNPKTMRKQWKKSDFVICEKCHSVFEKPGQKIEGAKLVKEGEKDEQSSGSDGG